MTAAERISLWLAQLRAAGRAVLAVRLTIAVAGAVALLVSAAQSWDQLDLVPVVGVPILIAAVVLPDSPTPLILLLTVTGGWLFRAPGEVSWSLVLIAISLLVVHLASAFAGQLPSYARVHRQALRRWLLPGAIGLCLAPVVALAAALVRGADVPGSLLITVGALLLVTVAIWFASGQQLGRD